jgi:hypothetical protein
MRSSDKPAIGELVSRQLSVTSLRLSRLSSLWILLEVPLARQWVSEWISNTIYAGPVARRHHIAAASVTGARQHAVAQGRQATRIRSAS